MYSPFFVRCFLRAMIRVPHAVNFRGARSYGIDLRHHSAVIVRPRYFIVYEYASVSMVVIW